MPSILKVAQIAPVWTKVPPDAYGGAELMVYWLTEELVRLGHRVTLFASGDSTSSAKLQACCEENGLLLNVLVKYQQTKEFLELAPRTQDDYREIIDNKIEPEFGDLPLAALAEKKCRGEFKDWRDRLALRSRRQADYDGQCSPAFLPSHSIAAGLTPIHARRVAGYTPEAAATKSGPSNMSSPSSRWRRFIYTCR